MRVCRFIRFFTATLIRIYEYRKYESCSQTFRPKKHLEFLIKTFICHLEPTLYFYYKQRQNITPLHFTPCIIGSCLFFLHCLHCLHCLKFKKRKSNAIWRNINFLGSSTSLDLMYKSSQRYHRSHRQQIVGCLSLK